MKKIIVFSILVFLTTPLPVFSHETKDINSEDFSGQYAECAAYYNLFSHASDSSYAKAPADVYRQLEKKALFYSLLLSIEGRTKDRAFEVTNSRFARYIQKMKHEADKNDEKLSLYHFGCQDALENPPYQQLEILMSMMSK